MIDLDTHLLPEDLQPGNAGAEGTALAGYAALVKALDLRVPKAFVPSVVSDRRVKLPKGSSSVRRSGHDVYDKSYAPEASFDGHLSFALKHEKIDLAVLKAIFDKTNAIHEQNKAEAAARGEDPPPHPMKIFVEAGPTGRIRRLAWFFHEWLTGDRLELPDLSSGNYVDAIDADFWHAASPINSPRHRIRDNLPGVPGFCALVERSVRLGDDTIPYVNSSAMRFTADGMKETVRRMVSRLLLKDSKSTFLIESERPSGEQQIRWSEVVATAGDRPLTLDLLIDLQKQLFKGRHLIPTGLRRDNVFLGDRIDNVAVPLWIGARPEDVPGLVRDLLAASERMISGKVDPIAHAAAIGFGWVFIHPFADGNGRTHRYILQHLLSGGGLRPAGMTLPIAHAIWQDMDGYSDVLNSFDRPRMPLIDWNPVGNGNVAVNNDTSDLYRYFDATEQARYLSERIAHVLDKDMPRELEDIRRRDLAVDQINRVIEMPDKRSELLIAVILQNRGRLSKAKRRTEFADLPEDLVPEVEAIVQDIYDVAPLDEPAPESMPTP